MSSQMTASIDQIKNLVKSFPKHIPVLIAGQPGIGKSDLFQQVAKELGARYMRFTMATMDAVDVKGCPFPVGDVTKFLPPEDFMELTNKAPSGYLGPMVANFDDIGAADESVFNALLGIMLQREVGLYEIRENVILCGTTNRAEDRAGARDLTTALNNRFVHFNLDPKFEEWVDWAFNNKIDPNIIGYLRARTDQLNTFDPKSGERAFATPRSIARASEILTAIGLDHRDKVLAVSSAVGMAWAMGFDTWLTKTRTLVTPEEILKDPSNCRVPDEDEIDVIHATTASLVSAVRGNTTAETMKAATIFCGRLPHHDIAVVLLSDINKIVKTADPKIQADFFTTDVWNDVYKKLGAIIN